MQVIVPNEYKKQNQHKHLGAIYIDKDGKEWQDFYCPICGATVSYRRSKEDIERYIKEGRWNFLHKNLDACWKDSICRDYYHEFLVAKFKRNDIEQKFIDKIKIGTNI